MFRFRDFPLGKYLGLVLFVLSQFELFEKTVSLCFLNQHVNVSDKQGVFLFVVFSLLVVLFVS